MKIDYRSEKDSYEPALTEKILQSRDDIKNGNGIKIAVQDLWK